MKKILIAAIVVVGLALYAVMMAEGREAQTTLAKPIVMGDMQPLSSECQIGYVKLVGGCGGIGGAGGGGLHGVMRD